MEGWIKNNKVVVFIFWNSWNRRIRIRTTSRVVIFGTAGTGWVGIRTTSRVIFIFWNRWNRMMGLRTTSRVVFIF